MKYHRAGIHVHLDCRNLLYHVLLFCVAGLLPCEFFPAVFLKHGCEMMFLLDVVRDCIQQIQFLMCFSRRFRLDEQVAQSQHPKSKCNVFTLI